MSTFYKALAAALILAAFFWMFIKPDHKPENTLIIGVQSGYPPFEFVDKNNNIAGFDIDLSQRIAEKLGKKLLIKDMEFEGMVLSLKQNKIDLILSGMHITSTRLKEISMIPYHGEAVTSLSLIFWNEIPAGVNSLESFALLPNATLSVESGSISELFMEKHTEIPTKSFQGALAGLMDVKFGKSSANLVESDVANYLQEKFPEVKIIPIPLGEDEEILGYGIGIKKQNKMLFEQVKQAIEELKQSGELKKLEEHWFKGEM